VTGVQTCALPIFFSLQQLKRLFVELKPIRIKAICYTDDGWVLLSGEGKRLSVSHVTVQEESRFDVIVSSKQSQAEVIEALEKVSR